MIPHAAQIASALSIRAEQADAVMCLLEGGNTVPFIARYRKEQTGSLDEVQIRQVEEQHRYAVQLEERKAEIVRLLEEHGNLTPALRQDIEAAAKLQRLEDLYRPFRQKRKTRASVAKARGLEPLADQIGVRLECELEAIAAQFIGNEVASEAEALAGARDILAERFADDAAMREFARARTRREGRLVAAKRKGAEDEKGVYEMYYDYEEPVSKAAPHRTLALNRGEAEGVLNVAIEPPQERILHEASRRWNRTGSSQMEAALEDAYKRLLRPAIERELRAELTSAAEEQAIRIFADNLRHLLLQPPLKGKCILGIDPAYRTGCKLAAIDETGKLLAVGVMYPHQPQGDRAGAETRLARLMQAHSVELIAIGNGTASRETERFVADVLKRRGLSIPFVIVSEAGASVYSASDVARAEFPDLQVEQRSAVSIARRLQDPLAELVKLEPKAVGVGQYQHDVSQRKLAESLSFVVETAVNQVGVDVNTASSSLLQYVSGLSKTVADNVIAARSAQGKFTSRRQLRAIPRLGAKTYEQAIGFLRIPGADHPFDATPIHPESYAAAERILLEADVPLELIGTPQAIEALGRLERPALARELSIGKETLDDLLEALMRPSRDPRDAFPQPLLKTDVLTIEDLQVGMELQGTVRNVVDFGAFVDIGVKQDGLVHISKLADRFIRHPADAVSLGDIVTVWVEEVDLKKGRIALTRRRPNTASV